ncbi:DUF6095 family protein [Polaribacter litorisediminis]|uniref:DUF6095 family protein n=1 Tax=Polaribacter litorisediminis TaxID=1908341 RepID=UPI001CBD4AA9|nr:DUF6095 family protein [Polaribacter litorisediminis]UAM99650.1 DUF6095 family protein [Polaribacter litorisediminis]
MSTDVNLLGKALIKLGFLLLLFIASPVLLTMSFKAIDKFNEAPNLYFAYVFVVFSILLLIFTIYYAFKTFKTLQDAFFNDDKKING